MGIELQIRGFTSVRARDDQQVAVAAAADLFLYATRNLVHAGCTGDRTAKGAGRSHKPYAWLMDYHRVASRYRLEFRGQTAVWKRIGISFYRRTREGWFPWPTACGSGQSLSGIPTQHAHSADEEITGTLSILYSIKEV
jgi:hypothetical protein